MPEWSLTSNDPLALTFSADGRLSKIDPRNDHTWEMEWGTGEPAALSFFTTYGLRARSMRIFHRFREGTRVVTAPHEMARPPIICAFYPNFLHLTFSPFEGIEVQAEYWVPESYALAGRLTLLNRSQGVRPLRVETCGLLIPLQGTPLLVRRTNLVNVLVGRTNDLSPVIFMTGEVEPGEGPFPSLRVDFSLLPGSSRQIVWVQAALEDAQQSFEQARRLAARPWEAEKARIEMLNASQTIEIHTGEQTWDAVLAMTQKEAARLILGEATPPFVARRSSDNGYASQNNGSDLPLSWQGLSPLEALYLASILPGTARSLLQSFLQTQDENGHIPLRPLAPTLRRVTATPLLTSLAQQIYTSLSSQEIEGLLSFFWHWFSPSQDIDRDGIPQWTHEMQPGLEDHLLFDLWNPWSQGIDFSAVHTPALSAMLLKEIELLEMLLGEENRKEQYILLEAQAAKLHALLARAWNPRRAGYRYLDRESPTHFNGKVLLRHRGNGRVRVGKRFKSPVRLVIEVLCEPARCHPRLTLWEDGQVVERFDVSSMRWRSGGLTVTSTRLYRSLDEIHIEGIGAGDRVIVRIPDLDVEDISTLLPLWAGQPTPQQAESLIKQALQNPQRFQRPFGIATFAQPPAKEAEHLAQRIEMCWNWLIGEGLLRYGMRREAAQLVERLMGAAIQTLRKQRAFYQYYHGQSGEGMGERSHLLGLFPLALFLKTLGVEIYSPTLVRLEGYNPFPWPVRLKYRGLEIWREEHQTEVVFPQGQRVVITTTAPCLVTLRRERAEVKPVP